MEQNNPVIPKSNNFLITLLSILLLISCIIAGFFAYQTQQLVKELRVARDELRQTPKVVPTSDPTADWKTYTNNSFKYSVKIPNHLEPVEVGMGGNGIANSNETDWFFASMNDTNNNMNKVNVLFEIKSFNIGTQQNYDSNCSSQNISSGISDSQINITSPIGGVDQFIQSSGVTTNKSSVPDYWWVINTCFIQNGIGHKISYQNFESLDKDPLFDQILSTFKFTESSPSSSPVACTMEAKLCPDGSSVGRTSPNCEFAPCPTPKN